MLAQQTSLPFTVVVRRHWRRVWSHWWDTPLTLLGNGLVMTVAWFVFPRDWVFVWTGPSGYALALSVWMYGDTVATKVLGADPRRGLALLDDGVALRRQLQAQTLVMWALVTPLCLLVSLAVATRSHQWLYTAGVIVFVSGVPFGALAVCSIVGVYLPYHQRSLRWRWQHRRVVGHVITRWVLLLLTPYLLYPLTCLAIAAPPMLLWTWSVRGPVLHAHRDAAFVVCVLLGLGLRLLPRLPIRHPCRAGPPRAAGPVPERPGSRLTLRGQRGAAG